MLSLRASYLTSNNSVGARSFSRSYTSAQSSHRLGFSRRLAAILAGACALAPASAQADESQRWSGGGGFNLGIAFASKSKPRFTFGFEAFAIRRFKAPLYGSYYSDKPLSAVGPLVQVNFFAGDGWRSTFGATGGWSPGNAENALMGELGATYRFEHKDWGLRVGALYEPLIATLAVHHDFFINETTLTGGFRMPGTFGAPLASYHTSSIDPVAGRPLRTEGNEAQRLARTDATSLKSKWAEMAQDEFEAIFAFGNLASELMAAGAPYELIARALRSAEQEVTHAQFCAQQAKQLDPSFELRTPANLFRAPLPGVEGLSRLALEGLVDG